MDDRRDKVAGKSFFLLSTFLIILSGIECGPVEKKAGPNVILISMDTVRADRLGCYGHRGIRTPSIDSLASRGVRFQNAISPAPLTLPSHTTILTGLYPATHGVRDNTTFRLSQKAVTLAEILKMNGYRTAAIVGAFVLDSQRGLDQGFDYYDDELPKPKVHPDRPSPGGRIGGGIREVSERPAGVVTKRALSWLRDNSDGKFFLWIHYFDPHYPYTPPPPYSREYRKRPYYGEIAFVDSNIGVILDELKNAGLLDNTLIILTGDHGESLGEHKEYTHCIFIYDSTIRVPLIMSWKGKIPAGKVIGDVVSLADLVPTILDLVGIDPGTSMDGVSLVDVINGKSHGERFIYSESMFPYLNYGWSKVYGIRGRRWKYIETSDPELYDLSRDPREINNLFDTEREVAERLSNKLDSLVSQKETEATHLAEEAVLSSRDLDRLEALGYVSGAPPAGENAPLRDPKEMIAFHDLINLGRQAMRTGDFEEALEQLREVIAGDPTNSLARNMIGMIYQQLEDSTKARTQFQKAIELNPDFTDAYRNLGNLFIEQGAYRRAAACYEKALELEPSAGDYCLALADIYSKMGDEEKARAFTDRAAELGYRRP